MAQYYTLDEAAGKLGLSVADFRRRMQTEWKTLRRFPDGSTLRFQTHEIDELARSLGRHSDPDLQLADAPLALADDEPPYIAPPPVAPAPPPKLIAADAPLALADDDFVPLTIEPAVTAKTGPASGRRKGTTGPDSDVKLELDDGGLKPHAFAADDSLTDVIDLDSERSEFEKGPRTAKIPVSAKAAPPKQTIDLASDSDLELKPTANKVPDGSSEFELSLAPDSDDYDLSLSSDGSDEVDLGTLPVSRDRAKGADSGINLQNPHDSGIALDDDFELKLEPELADAGKGVDDSDSEFELTLDEPQVEGSAATAAYAAEEKELFETDFELPAAEAEGESTDLESSDFDIGVDDSVEDVDASDSEIEAIDDEAEPLDELEAEADEAVEDDEDVEPVRTREAVDHAWGPIPALALFPCVAVMFVVGLMSLELVGSMWGYKSPGGPQGVVVRGIANLFGTTLPE